MLLSCSSYNLIARINNTIMHFNNNKNLNIIYLETEKCLYILVDVNITDLACIDSSVSLNVNVIFFKSNTI